jgi:hypothetical protein
LEKFKNLERNKCHNVGKVPKSNRNIMETETTWISLTHIYIGMKVHFPSMAQVLQLSQMAGLI